MNCCQSGLFMRAFGPFLDQVQPVMFHCDPFEVHIESPKRLECLFDRSPSGITLGTPVAKSLAGAGPPQKQRLLGLRRARFNLSASYSSHLLSSRDLLLPLAAKARFISVVG